MSPAPVRRRPSRAELAGFAGATVPDLLPPAGTTLRLLFVGINPGLWTAATGAHFARPGNRFYPALHAAGLVERVIDVSDADRQLILKAGIGITNLVSRATATAAELTRQELRDGAGRLTALVAQRAPSVVAVVGVTAYRTAFGEPRAQLGEQPYPLAGSRLFVLPNPSGLNAHYQVDDLATWFAQAGAAAGLPKVN